MDIDHSCRNIRLYIAPHTPSIAPHTGELIPGHPPDVHLAQVLTVDGLLDQPVGLAGG